MKIRHLVLALTAAGLLAASCEKNEDPMALKADISAAVETLTFTQDMGTKDFELKSTRDWKMNDYEEGVDWVSVTPESGSAAVKAQKLTVTVRANTGHDRETDLSFTNGTKTIAVHVYQNGPLGPGGPIFQAKFEKDLCGFTIEDKVAWSEGSAWTADSHGYAKATGKVGSTFNASDSYLISPVIDLSGETAAWLQFRHAAFSSAISKDASVLVREEGQTEWTTLEPEAWPSNWTFVAAGDMDLKAWLGKKIQIAFRFKSTASNSDTWEVDNVVISREATPVVECANVADVVAQKNNTKVHVSRMTVQVVYAHGYLVSDGTDYLLVYLGEEVTPTVKAGDVLSMNATLIFYGTSGASFTYPQLTNPKEVETTATGQTVTLPEPADLTSTFGTFSIDPATKYLKFYKVDGKIAVSGEYINFNVTGVTDRTGSVIAADGMGDVSALNGLDCTITGFFLYASGAKNQYITFLATDISIKANYLMANPTSVTVEAAGGEAEIAITSDQTWEIPAVDGLSFDKTGGTGNATVKVTVAANAAYESKTYTMAVKAGELTANVQIKQAAAVDPNAKTAELTNAEIIASLSANGGDTSSYADFTFTSASGNWVGNVSAQKTNKYVQIRNSKGAYIMTPQFSTEIAKIEFVTDADKGNQKRTVHVMPANFNLPGKGDNSANQDNYNSTTKPTAENPNSAAVAAASLGSVTTSTTAGETWTIEVAAGHKQVMLIAYDGAVYMSSIKVWLKSE